MGWSVGEDDGREWIEWKLNDESWQRWREDNPRDVERLKEALSAAVVHGEV